MPFTPSHAVVALPFARAWPGLAAAVAVGAMTPDLPLFVRGTPLTYAITHSWAWIPLTTLVSGILLAAWWLVIRPGVRELSPLRLAARLPDEWDLRFQLARPAAAIPVLVVGLALGVATHIAWDAFTHEGRAGVVGLGLDAAWGPLPGYKWLQCGSSVVGLMILAVAGARWLRGRAAEAVDRILPDAVRVVWWASLPLSLALAWLLGLATLGGARTDAESLHELAYRALPPAVAAWAALSIALCVVVRVRRRAHAPA